MACEANGALFKHYVTLSSVSRLWPSRAFDDLSASCLAEFFSALVRPCTRLFSAARASFSCRAFALRILLRLTTFDDTRREPYDGAIIFAGMTMASKSSAEIPSAKASSFKVVPFLWAFFATLAARS